VEWVAGNPAIMAALVIALAAAVTDARTRTIPNALVAAGALAGCLLNGWTSGTAGLTRAAVGCLAGFCVFLPFFLLRGMGGGDVKLMAALGSCLGPLPILQTALAASVAGAVMAIVVAIRHGVLARTMRGAGHLLGSWVTRGPRVSHELSLDNPSTLKIPYALPIAFGALYVVCVTS